MTDTHKSANSTTATGKASKGFTAEERAAMKERAKELRTEARAEKDRAAGERAVLAKIAEMPEPDRTMAQRLHAIIKESAPVLSPKTWYGMPPMPRRARSSATSHRRRSSRSGTRRLASTPTRTSTKALCGRPPSR